MYPINNTPELTYGMIFYMSPFVSRKPKKLCAIKSHFVLNSYHDDDIIIKCKKTTPKILSEYCNINKKIHISSPILYFTENKKKQSLPIL